MWQILVSKKGSERTNLRNTSKKRTIHHDLRGRKDHFLKKEREGMFQSHITNGVDTGR